MNLVSSQNELFEKSIEHLKKELTSLRIGRATPALVEDIKVVAYGMSQQIKAIASISATDAKTLTIEPWDKTVLGDIESSIRNSDLGINPVNDGKLLRLVLPDLTKDRRQDLIKVLHKKLEEARISVRKVREDIKKQIDNAEKNKEISEDERFTQIDQLDTIVKECNEKVKQIGEEKEKEINTV